MPRNRRVDEQTSLWVRFLFVGGLFFYAFALQFTTPNLASLDGYFHIRYSDVLREAGWRGFPPPFSALPFTLLSKDRFADHHMLFHLWLVPFTRGDLILGAKLAAAIGAAAAFCSLYLFLVWRGIRRAEWWTVAGLATAPGFLYRMEMPRAQSWAVVCLILGLAILSARRCGWMLLLACFFTWLYNAFPAILGVAACFVVAERVRNGRWYWPALFYPAAGVGLAIVVNPYFPNNLRFMLHHYADKVHIAEGVAVGSEWRPFAPAEWLGWVGLVALLIGIGTLLYRRRQTWSAEDLATSQAALLFLVMLWHSARFIEYFVPFAAAAVAVRWHRAADDLTRRSSPRRRRWIGTGLALWLAVTTVIAAVQLRSRPPADLYRGASTWIRNHASPGDIVFNVGWDDFPLLYFYNPDLRYIVGLDPSFLASRDAGLYRQWEQLTLGVQPEPARAIETSFGARIAIANLEEELFISAMDDDRQAVRAYSDEQAVVYLLQADPVHPANPAHHPARSR